MKFSYLQKNPDLAATAVAFCMTLLLVPFEPLSMLRSINFPLLGLLFCLMSIVAGLRKSGLLAAGYQRFLHGAVSSRSVGRFFIFSCFFSSMLVTNDVALIIFVPLAILTLTECRAIRLIIPVITWQTIAANMGSMLTPIGNPQNLFIYSYYQMGVWDFLMITGPVTILSGIIIFLATYSLPQKQLKLQVQGETHLPKGKILILLILFTLCLLNVLRIVPSGWMMASVTLAISFLDRSLFREVDYKLLLLFVFLFLTVNNLTRIELLSQWAEEMLTGHVFLISLVFSQFLSNVPTTVMLAPYVQDPKPLLLGVNIGGLGTVIASMASMISLKAYLGMRHPFLRWYLTVFTGANLLLLAILLVFCRAVM